MPGLLQYRAVQSELGKPQRARRVIVAGQLAALVVLRLIAQAITQALRTHRLPARRLFKHRHRAQPSVVLHPARAPAIPLLDGLPRLPLQRHTPPGIDAACT
ncbi:hypothetical protein D3C76_1428580 [compost metagenome]